LPFTPLSEAKRTLVGRAEHGELVLVRGRRWGDVGLLLESGRHGGEREEIGIFARREVRDTRSFLGDG
jgi:hypothetical protein